MAVQHSSETRPSRVRRGWMFGKWMGDQPAHDNEQGKNDHENELAGYEHRTAATASGYSSPPLSAYQEPVVAPTPNVIQQCNLSIAYHNRRSAAGCTCQQGAAGEPGPPGDDGVDGMDGKPGVDGSPGKDGVMIAAPAAPEPCIICPIGPPGPSVLDGHGSFIIDLFFRSKRPNGSERSTRSAWKPRQSGAGQAFVVRK